MGVPLERDLSTAAAVYSQDRQGSRTAYNGSRREVANRSELQRERQRDATVSRLTTSVGDAPRRPNLAASQSKNVHSSHGAPRKVAKIAHFDINHKHVHGANCGHHNYDGRWHDYSRRHRHGPGCGHHFHGGSWVSFSIGHRHGPGCGHFYDHGAWLSHSGVHHHGVGCGHYFWGGVWRNYSRFHAHFDGCGHYRSGSAWFDFPLSHRHSSTCGHLYDGLGWYTHGHVGHVHGAGCGHYYYGGVWSVYPRTYYTRGRRNNFYFFVNLGDFRRRNVPEYVYEESIYIEEDPVDVYEDSSPLSRAYAAFAKGSFYESVIAFNESIDADPENGVLYLARAQAHIAIADYRTAYEDLIRGMELVPEWTEVEFSVAELYANPDWFEEHYESLARWVSDYPRDYKAHFVLGYIHYFQQDYSAAKSEFIYTLAWDKDHPQAAMLMDSILAYEAEAEVRAVEKEDVEAFEEEQNL